LGRWRDGDHRHRSLRGRRRRVERPFFEDWVRSLRDQCAAQGVAFFYKQRLDAKGRKISLPMLDGVRHAAMPEVPRV